jgi:hypothetical protein
MIIPDVITNVITNTDTDFNDILSEFPKFELSYETMIHNKVLNNNNDNILLAIPEGVKCFAWFTTYKADNVCFILETGQDNRITKIQICLTSFDDKLSYGTIFYGTIFKYKNTKCFSIEDIYYYKGQNCLRKSFIYKLDILKNVLNNEISQQALTNNFVIFGLPIISDNYDELSQELIPYKMNQIKIRYQDNPRKISFYNHRMISNNRYQNIRPNQYQNIRPNSNENIRPNSNENIRPNSNENIRPNSNENIRPNSNENNNNNKNKNLQPFVFKVTPDIQNDVYHLFYMKDGKEEFLDYASIPDYTTSVMMNKLFRNIKENTNLDLLEESDDEDEFENENIDKFVYLDKSFNMICKYNYRFKKWYPIEIAKKTDNIVLSTQIQNYARK